MIYQGTYDDPKDPKAVWEEYEFKCKPGKITRRPCIISPYHYRLDWLLWFAAFEVCSVISYHIIQLFHTFLCNSQNYYLKGAVDDLMHSWPRVTVQWVIHRSEG